MLLQCWHLVGKFTSILHSTTAYSRGGHNTAHAGYRCGSCQVADQRYSGSLQAHRGKPRIRGFFMTYIFSNFIRKPALCSWTTEIRSSHIKKCILLVDQRIPRQAERFHVTNRRHCVLSRSNTVATVHFTWQIMTNMTMLLPRLLPRVWRLQNVWLTTPSLFNEAADTPRAGSCI